MNLMSHLNVNNSNGNTVNNLDSIEQKLEQNEKIMQIYSESLPHQRNNQTTSLIGTNDNNSSDNQVFNAVQPILKLFAKQLLTLTKNCNKKNHSYLYNRHPSLRVWLQLLNTSQKTLDTIVNQITFHDLYEKNDEDMKDFLKSLNTNDQEVNIIVVSLQNLKSYYKNLEMSNSTATTPNILSLNLSTTNDAKSTNQNDQNNNNIYSPLLSTFSNCSTTGSASVSNRNNQVSTTGSATVTTPTITAPCSGSSSSSSELLNLSNSNESQLSSSSTSSIASEIKQNNKGKINETPPKDSIESGCNTPKLATHLAPKKIFNINPQPQNQHISKKHTKSESDTIVLNENDYFNDDLNEAKKKRNQDSNTKLMNQPINNNSIGNSNQVVKNLTFSPTLQIKSNNQKKSGGQQKVTTPPPFRKLSTGNPSNLINVNSHIHAAALAAATARIKAEHSSKNSDNQHRTSNKYSQQNMQRSSSHESHLRNKIQPPHKNSCLVVPNKNYVKTSNSSCENIYRSIDGSELSGHSGQASPLNSSPIKKNANYLFTDDYYKNNNLSIPKSPKQYRDHRWSNTFKVTNCGYCQKKMIIGIKCRTCKFRCHKECEKKFSPICPSVFVSFLPPISAQQSSNASDLNLYTAQNSQNQNPDYNNNMTAQSSSLISSSSSAGSSTLPSPALINNNIINFSQINDISSKEQELNQQHTWPSGAIKVARVANKIVNSINSVSTPKSNRKQIPQLQQPQHQKSSHQAHNHQAVLSSSKNFFNESSSSCNSSGPNSPSYFKQQQLKNDYQTASNNNTDKKSSSSSNSISSGIQNNNNSQQQQQNRTNIFSYNNPALLSPITMASKTNLNKSQNNSNTPNSLTRNVEFFGNPIIKRTTSVDSSQFDDSVDSQIYEQNNLSQNNEINESNLLTVNNILPVHNNNETDENPSNSGQLDFKRSNNSTVVDSSNDFDTDHENTNYSEYEPNEQDLNQLNFSQDFKQFNITYEEITDKEEIGRGRFGCVYKAQWHGPHAVKEIDFEENLTEDSKELNNFKQEVLNLKKTRHANLILFVGACMKPPKCAIVMSLCRGVSLYKYLHTELYQKPNFDWTIDIATQIAQGMGYLHNKQMIHKDLRSKNIFIDGCKAVIADFGLYSITRLCKKLKRNDLLPITKECVYYMAPELIRLLGTTKIDTAFSQASDVFSFGTVWYELLYYEYPFQFNSTDTIIYLIGHGIKNISPNIQIPKEFKNILLKCWSKDASTRPNFSHLLETFRAIPKRKLFRSPSHPVHIGRSLEALHSSALTDMKN